MGIRKWEFNVETIEAGQRRKYGDSYYYYIVESKQSLHVIESFCKKILSPAISVEQYRKEENDSLNNHFRQYFTTYNVLNKAKLMSGELNKVEYKVVSPSTH